MRESPSQYEDQFNDLYAGAYRVAYRVCGDRSDAQDIAQEAMVRLHLRWRKVHGYAPQWTARVAGNLAIDRSRSTSRRVRREVAVSVGAPTITEPAADHIDLVRALLLLSPRQREVLVLRYLADFSEEATGKALGCSIGTVKTHASRGIQALRSAMGDPT